MMIHSIVSAHLPTEIGPVFTHTHCTQSEIPEEVTVSEIALTLGHI